LGIFADTGTRVAMATPKLLEDGTYITSLNFSPALDAPPFSGAIAGPLMDASYDTAQLVFPDATVVGTVNGKMRVDVVPLLGPSQAAEVTGEG
jgi:hypothetical protein